MADKFECDSCKQLKSPDEKRGTLELKAFGCDTLPHANFSGKLEICGICFSKYQKMFMDINPMLAAKMGPIHG